MPFIDDRTRVIYGFILSNTNMRLIQTFPIFHKMICDQIASKIEKLQRDFLWSRAGEGKKDHLIKWDVVCRPKVMGGLGFGKTSLRNNALLGK